jgi:hypothetical protein
MIRGWSTADDEQLRKLALAGLSLAEMSAQIGRSKPVISARAMKLDIAIAIDRSQLGRRLKERAKKQKT